MCLRFGPQGFQGSGHRGSKGFRGFGEDGFRLGANLKVLRLSRSGLFGVKGFDQITGFANRERERDIYIYI